MNVKFLNMCHTCRFVFCVIIDLCLFSKISTSLACLENSACLCVWCHYTYCNAQLLRGCQHVHKCTNHTLLSRGESVKIKFFSIHLFNFLAWFLLLSCGFLALKKWWCVFLFGVEGVSESVWFVHLWKCWHLWTVPNVNTECRHIIENHTCHWFLQ